MELFHLAKELPSGLRMAKNPNQILKNNKQCSTLNIKLFSQNRLTQKLQLIVKIKVKYFCVTQLVPI